MVVTSDFYVNNNKPFKSNKVIIVTSWDGHLMFLREALKSYQKTGAFIICAYDRHSMIPPSYIMDLADAWVFKHRTYGAEKRNGWLWNVVYAANLIAPEYTNIEYVFTVNSDCIWERPKGINDLCDMLGTENVLMSSSSNGTIHTCAVVYKAWLFKKFVTYIKHKLEINPKESYSPEVLLRDYVKNWSLPIKVPPVQAKFPKGHLHEGSVDHYSAYKQDSTWKQIVGFRNLGGEHKWSCLEHLEPVEAKYMDLTTDQSGYATYFSKHEQNLFQYYITNDRRWLYKYWAEGEDSYYNRIYKPLSFYGNMPLYDDSERRTLGPPSERLGIFNRFNLDFDLRGIKI